MFIVDWLADGRGVEKRNGWNRRRSACAMHHGKGLKLRNVCRTRYLVLMVVAAFPSIAWKAERVEARGASSPPAAETHPTRSDWRSVVSGRLANGVRYAILPRTGSEPGVALLMRNEGGFIAERRPGQRGLAHLIEHIAFLSPTIGAPDDLHHLPHVGLPLTLPAPSAGTTDWRETNYFLSTKANEPTDLNTLLGLFREVASDLTMRPDAVDEARAQVEQEMAGRKLGNEVYASYIASVAPGSPTDVIDAQNSDDVATATVGTIRSLYGRIYRPRNTMVVVVGNVDAPATKALIEKQFGGWRRTDPAPPPTPVPSFQAGRIRPISFATMKQGRRVALMTVVTPSALPSPSRREQSTSMIMDMLVTRAVNDRLARSQPDSPAGKLGMFIENGEQGHRLIMVWDNFVAEEWRPALTNLRRTTCDLISGGFTTLEWSAAKQGLIRELQRKSGDMAQTPNVELAKDLSHAAAAGRQLIPPDELLRDALLLLPTMSAASGTTWWQRQWRAGIEHVRVEAPELARQKDPLAAIRRTADDAATCKVRP